MKNWSEVLENAKKRREAGADAGANNFDSNSNNLSNLLVSFANDSTIQALSKKMATDDKLSQATLAIGVTCYSGMIYAPMCRKGISPELTLAIAEALCRAGGPTVFVDEFSNNITGLHAEMAILKRIEDQKVKARDNMGGNVYIMCIGKLVCMDCAGYMNSKTIGHCSLVSQGSTGELQFACGKVSTMGGGQWQHPFSGAVYIGGNTINTYQKGGKSINQFS